MKKNWYQIFLKTLFKCPISWIFSNIIIFKLSFSHFHLRLMFQKYRIVGLIIVITKNTSANKTLLMGFSTVFAEHSFTRVWIWTVPIATALFLPNSILLLLICPIRPGGFLAWTAKILSWWRTRFRVCTETYTAF